MGKNKPAIMQSLMCLACLAGYGLEIVAQIPIASAKPCIFDAVRDRNLTV
jgi:hypothetical protein